MLSSISKLSNFVRLERLALDNIEPKHLEQVFGELISLPMLSSLIIISIRNVNNISIIYRQIICLPALKYCQLLLGKSSRADSLPVATNEYSSMEHLIINHCIFIDQLVNLLSYVPQFRRLSVHLLRHRWNQ
ncbi:unnamed protein product [Rotaria sp. Silwood2]|nr:unnamed protein product [Rotaria sp. Silwood2]